MGREKEYRQRLKYQIFSSSKKTINNLIKNELQQNLGLSEVESQLLAVELEKWISQQFDIRGPNQIFVKGASSRNSFGRKVNTKGDKRIKITPFKAYDLDLELEFNLKVMQLARILRLIEEAYAQDSLLSSKQLSLILNITPTSLRNRLKGLRNNGIWIPTRGLSKKEREKKGKFRSTYLLEIYFKNEDITEARNFLAISKTHYRDILYQFHLVLQSVFNNEFSSKQPEAIEWKHLIAKIPEKELKVFNETFPNVNNNNNLDLKNKLTTDFNYSQIMVRAIFEFLEEIKSKIKEERKDMQVVHWAVASFETAGKPLTDCQLVPVILSYIAPVDLQLKADNKDLNRLSGLKFAKIFRYASETKKAGGYLTYADLSYLMGISTDSLRRLVKNNSQIIMPLRGRECDIGKGISHKKKIIRLYLEMYTESEIVTRTGHSYEAVENYIKEFATVFILYEKRLPPAMIRKVTRRSRQLIESYLELIMEHSAPEYSFRFHQLRQIFSRNQGKIQKRGPIFR